MSEMKKMYGMSYRFWTFYCEEFLWFFKERNDWVEDGRSGDCTQIQSMRSLNWKELIVKVVVNLRRPIMESPEVIHCGFNVFVSTRSSTSLLGSIDGEGRLELIIDVLKKPSDVHVHRRNHVHLWLWSALCSRHDLKLSLSSLQNNFVFNVVSCTQN